jgi:PhnB protein
MKSMIMPYLHFKGNCEEAFNFYANAFGANSVRISRLNGDPANPVMHASVMLTESGGVSGADFEEDIKISGMEILVLLPSREKVEEILPKLAEGGTVVSRFQPHPPPDDAGGGATVLDKYGYTWFLCV